MIGGEGDLRFYSLRDFLIEISVCSQLLDGRCTVTPLSYVLLLTCLARLADSKCSNCEAK